MVQDRVLLAVGCRWPGGGGGGGGGGGVQLCGKWFENMRIGLFPCFFSTALLSYKGKNFFFLLPWKNNSTHI